MKTLLKISLLFCFSLLTIHYSPLTGYWSLVTGHESLAQSSQSLSSSSKKAKKFYQQAYEQYQRRDFSQAIASLGKALEADPGFAEAYALKGDLAAEQHDMEGAITNYGQAVQLLPGLDYNLYVILGNLKLLTGRYEEAKRDYIRYLSFNKGPSNRRWQTEENIHRCDFGIEMVSHPVPFNPVNLGDSINTMHDEYINAISSDKQTLYFTRRLPTRAITDVRSEAIEEDFYLSSLSGDSAWLRAYNLGPPINTRGNEGAISISPDGQLLFFAACQREDGFGSCDIYWSWKMGNRWSAPRNLGPVVNSMTWDSQPSFSSDGKTLYFASKRSGGKGSSDIWKSELLPTGDWTPPVNLGDSVNTAGEEQNPFIHPDDQTLYFASKGHEGMGGLDLFYTRRKLDGAWQTPENLGYPINTYADEITLVVNSTGDVAYISSDKFGGKGRQDIYSFPLYKEAQPNPVTYLKGIVFDKETGNLLQAHFELTDLERNEVAVQSISDPVDGSFLVCLPADRDYALNVSREGYLFYSDNFALTGIRDQAKPFLKNIPLQPIRVGETVVLKNIFFDTDKYDLKPISYIELEKLVHLLRTNPSLKIEISGHTDIIGSEEHNLELSENRAKAVFNYLVDQGISYDRMTYSGYGFDNPIDTNDTEAGRANNRRTEFRIVGR
ncbi:MAG: PD40 domain-containing protein [Bacteroidales bacterium]|nr:PD40 domain-containing protein [Bacteroidales bacterium]